MRSPSATYGGGLIAFTAACLALPVLVAAASHTPWWRVAVLGLLALIPATELALAVVHHVVVRSVGPTRLTKLSLEDGVPEDMSTLVVIPTLLACTQGIDDLLARLEVHHLSNDDGELRFALASDWCDADAECVPTDDALLARARVGVAELNARHGPMPGGGPRFMLLHRRRLWNECDGHWMGWERKRGKLHELNALLRGAVDTTFMDDPAQIGADPASLTALRVRYVITLDTDTLLPRGVAKKLVGAMAHPLNRPIHDPRTGCVVQGYGILQPRIQATLAASGVGSLVQRIYSGVAGLDPYAFAISDVYQDLFGEGSYCGKGIYDLDAFELALKGRVPENAMLSHDLFEGLHARAGLISDIELFEDFPGDYQVLSARGHRWARGDWQLLPWIFRRGPISALGRWKMMDNLRRSLVAPAALATLIMAWLLAGPHSAPWVALVLASLTLPALAPALAAAPPRRGGLEWRVWARTTAHDLGFTTLRVMLDVVLLAEQATRMLDAIGRALYRMAVSGRHRLEWVSSGHVSASSRLTRSSFARHMWPAVAVGVGTFVLLAWVPDPPSDVGVVLAVLWIASPWVAFAVSATPVVRARSRLTAADAADLRSVARRTWRYFETFVTAEEHHLPPDNFQEEPRPVVAHRTSPTNIGLYVLSAISAHDMGWIGTTELIERLGATLSSLDGMIRHQGHFLNWYDTRTLEPLSPRYISTVDSGNLAGHLLTAQQACLELVGGRSSVGRSNRGIADALHAVQHALVSLGADRRGGTTGVRDVSDATVELARLLDSPPDLEEGLRWAGLVAQTHILLDASEALSAERPELDEIRRAATSVRDAVASHQRDRAPSASPGAQDHELKRLAATCGRLCFEHDWAFLFNKKERLFAIGYNVEAGTLDPVHYDLLASECRLASFLAIADGAVPVSHWFRLGRRLTAAGGGSILLSWSGSMFEYLMPDLVMAAPVESLLGQTVRRVVRFQIRYGRDRGVPWGISEACYNIRDTDQTYQYSNFGASGLGLRTGLGDDMVVAPYATALAAMVEPGAAVRNLHALSRAGASGRYGFYDAVDYTAARLPDNTSHVVVKTYMAHHQGMSIVAMCGVVNGFPMRRRFHSARSVESAVLLLHEQAPRQVDVALRRLDAAVNEHVRVVVAPVLRQFDSPHQAVSSTHRLSNGRYSVAISAAGAGGSAWNDLSVTRWREDDTLDPWGTFIYIRDVDRQRVWSAGFQPTCVDAMEYRASFYEHHVEISRRDGSLTTTLDVVVASEDDAELRQLTIVNAGLTARELDLTSYAEVVLAAPTADLTHPAFSNLFVRTEFDVGKEALLASRKPREDGEASVWAAHMSVVQAGQQPGVQFETDRARFLGRGRSARTASAVFDGLPLSNTVGPVLDPVFSLRRRVRVGPGETVRVLFVTLVGHSREQLVARCDAYREIGAFDRTVGQAWNYSQIQLRHLGLDPESAQLYQRLGSRLQTLDPAMRAPRELIERNQLGQRALWRFGISGDRPILLARVQDAGDHDMVRQLVHAHCYLRLKGLAMDLVLLNEFTHTYGSDRLDTLEGLVRASHLAGLKNGVHIVRSENLSTEERDLLLASARVMIDSRNGSLYEQVTRHLRAPIVATPQVRSPSAQSPAGQRAAAIKVEFFNGVGGFASDGREYVVSLGADQWTPTPWVNVLANDGFGCVISEAGSGYTWAQNSHENQLTPWSNDPVCDPPSEVIYLVDQDTGEVWTATPLPVRESTSYVIRHGQGWTSFEHESHGVASTLTVFVMPDDPVKVSRLVLHNRSGRPRRIGVTAYAEWVLGSRGTSAKPFVITSHDDETGAVFARSSWKLDYAGRTAFLHMSGTPTHWSADRAQFLGRNGSFAAPAALARGSILSSRSGAARDPCAVLGVVHLVGVEASVEVVVRLGQADDESAARALLARVAAIVPQVTLDLLAVRWDEMLGVVQVRTPDRELDLLMNRWLLYQTLASRMWARAGLYQAGGAYGFRDQLQDGMALVLTRPDLTRAHLLRAASRQFVEGDVQHWWHPPSGMGTRTRSSDDRLWLPYVVAHYLEATGDVDVLAEDVPFLDAATLADGVQEAYLEPAVSAEVASLYEHAARAIDVSQGVGRHGLPLIGSGDWNDGMNRVGREGLGESVWLAWFLISTMRPWIELARVRGDDDRAQRWAAHSTALSLAVEADGWDGAWYRRAFMDDGSPLGSAVNVECRIDSIAQSWAVLSGAGTAERARQAMSALDLHLARELDGVVLLLTPPFDVCASDPGYIRSYLPGVRENGGQYTHAAVWAVMAFAALGDGNKAGELFRLLNPINHAKTRAGVQRYKVEPYVVAADVYGAAPHLGRGGWTWYTGSAAWMYRAGLESILGLNVRGDRLHLTPCVPDTWPGFEITLTLQGTRFSVRVINPSAVQRGLVSLTLDGVVYDPKVAQVPLVKDGAGHEILATMGV